MISVKYKYPEDPEDSALLVYGLEFKRANREIRVTSLDQDFQPTSETAIPVDGACCDSCNAEIADIDPCALTHRRLYCWACFEQWIKPHITSIGEQP
jgi:hypothetical protein